jgi:hypothetical protein
MSQSKWMSGASWFGVNFLRFIKILAVPTLSYLPAFILVAYSFDKFKDSKPPQSSSQQASPSPVSPSPLPTESQVAGSKTNGKPSSLDGKQPPSSNKPGDPTSSMPQVYTDLIKSTTKNEAAEQSEKAVKQELEKLKADWKGDLYGQISFPLVFAIASIFAAFAVKDILIELLKKQEQESISKAIEDRVRATLPRMLEESIRTSKKDIAESLQTIEAHMSWLEFQMLKIEIDSEIDNLEQEFKSKGLTKDLAKEFNTIVKRLFLNLKQSDKIIRSDYLMMIEEHTELTISSQLKRIGITNTSSNGTTTLDIRGIRSSSETARINEIETFSGEEILRLQAALFLLKLEYSEIQITNDEQEKLKKILEKNFREEYEVGQTTETEIRRNMKTENPFKK